jgi:hypothetical protein
MTFKFNVKKDFSLEISLNEGTTDRTEVEGSMFRLEIVLDYSTSRLPLDVSPEFFRPNASSLMPRSAGTLSPPFSFF